MSTDWTSLPSVMLLNACAPISFAARNLGPMPGWQLAVDGLLLNLHSGERSELLLAFDSSVTCRFEFDRVPDFVEVR